MTEHCPDPHRDCPWDKAMIVEHGKLLEGLSNLKKEMHTGFEGINKRLDKQNGRIGKLENWRWYIMGIIAAAVVWLKIGGKI